MSDFQDVLDRGRVIFADGLIAGKPFADIMTDIMVLGERYGCREAEDKSKTNFFVSTRHETFANAQREVVLAGLEYLFSGKRDISSIIWQAAAMGAACGFQSTRAMQKA